MNARYDKKCVPNEAEKLTNSERGCAASHLALWRRLASGQIQGQGEGSGIGGSCLMPANRMIIFEDDARLASNFVPALRELWETLDRMDARGFEWDVVFLGYINAAEHPCEGRAKERKYVEASQRPGTVEKRGPKTTKVKVGGREKAKAKAKGRGRGRGSQGGRGHGQEAESYEAVGEVFKEVKLTNSLLFKVEYIWGAHAYVINQVTKNTQSKSHLLPAHIYVDKQFFSPSPSPLHP